MFHEALTEEQDQFDFLVDIDPEIWVKAKKEAELRKMTFTQFVESALWHEIEASAKNEVRTSHGRKRWLKA